MDLWDVELNLYSSNKALTTMRKKFEIQKDLDQLNRNRSGIEQIYEGKQNNIQKRNSLFLGAVSIILTVSTVVDVINAIIDQISSNWSEAVLTFLDKYLMAIIIGLAIIAVAGWFGLREIKKNKDKTTIKNKK